MARRRRTRRRERGGEAVRLKGRHGPLLVTGNATPRSGHHTPNAAADGASGASRRGSTAAASFGGRFAGSSASRSRGGPCAGPPSAARDPRTPGAAPRTERRSVCLRAGNVRAGGPTCWIARRRRRIATTVLGSPPAEDRGIAWSRARTAESTRAPSAAPIPDGSQRGSLEA